MALESATYINDLVITNPVGATDPKGQGDDHIRMIKAVLKATFPNLTAAVTLTPTQMNQAAFPAGTKMLFVQTAAPTGWVKDVTHDDKALRVVTGAAGTGGTVNFTTAFASKTVAGTNTGTAITAANLPAHTHTQQGTFTSGGQSVDHTHVVAIVTSTESANHQHTIPAWAHTGNNVAGTVAIGGDALNLGSLVTNNQTVTHTHNVNGSTQGVSVNHAHDTTISGQTGSIGSGTTHTHAFTGTAIDMAVKYVDCIICTKS